MAQTSWLNFAMGALATKRLTRLVVTDKITEDLRNQWFDRFPPETTKIGYLVSCPKCTSVWAGFLVAGVSSPVQLPRTVRAAAAVVIGALAMSEAVIMADEFEKSINQLDDDDDLFN